MSNAPAAILKMDGQAWSGWMEVTIARSMEQASGTFELKLTDRWPGSDVARPIVVGSRCQLLLGDQPVITGHIDDVNEDWAAESHDFSVSGRDAVADLVDCSAVHKSGEWKNAKLEDFAADLAEPFGVTVAALTDTGKAFESFRIQEGETAFEAIERACRQRALLLQSDGIGGLVIVSGPGELNAHGALKFGKAGNVLRLSRAASGKERFSTYTVKGQGLGQGELDIADISAPEGIAKDAGVGRYRPLIVLAEEPGNGPSFEDRARWELRVRAARATRIFATVQGWTDQNGTPWRPGWRVPLDFPHFQGEAQIVAVRLTLGSGGTLAELELMRPGALDQLAEPDKEDAAW